MTPRQVVLQVLYNLPDGFSPSELVGENISTF